MTKECLQQVSSWQENPDSVSYISIFLTFLWKIKSRAWHLILNAACLMIWETSMYSQSLFFVFFLLCCILLCCHFLQIEVLSADWWRSHWRCLHFYHFLFLLLVFNQQLWVLLDLCESMFALLKAITVAVCWCRTRVCVFSVKACCVWLLYEWRLLSVSLAHCSRMLVPPLGAVLNYSSLSAIEGAVKVNTALCNL